LSDTGLSPAFWDGERVAGRLRGCRLGDPPVFLDRVESTIDEIWRRAGVGAEEGLMVVAETQTQGRGRSGNIWHSPAGVGVWVSYLLSPALPAGQLALLTLAGGVAAAKAAEACGVAVGLKWPNDLIAIDGTGRKIGGVLAESRARGSGWWVVLSMGINVNALAEDFPADLRPRAASLRVVAGHPVSREDLLVHLTTTLAEVYGSVEAGDPGPLLEDWRRYAAVLGRAVRVRGGTAEVEGVAQDVGEDGALIVRLQGGAELEVHAGELEVVWEGGGGAG
jgi:BirA family biotin operon repressor/biotin-[acetyl-CoA-carboxylase] ligase